MVIVVGFVTPLKEHRDEQSTAAETLNVFVLTGHANMGVLPSAAYGVGVHVPIVPVDDPKLMDIGVPVVTAKPAAAVVVKVPSLTTLEIRIARGKTATVVGFDSVPVNVQGFVQPEVVATFKTDKDAPHANSGVVASAAYVATEQPAIE